MAYNWLKWFHGAVSDDKWPLIARKSGQPVAVVIAVWAALLECASQADDRGSIADFDAESMDAVLQVADGTCEAIVAALSDGKRPRIEDERIANWEKRQEEPQDPTGKERKRRQRERERQAKLEHESGQSPDDSSSRHTVPRDEVTESGRGTENTGQTLSRVPSSGTDKTRIEEKRQEEDQTAIRDLENLNRARARGESQTVFGGEPPGESPLFPGDDTPPSAFTGTGDEPTIEFVELRDFYSREARSEGEQTGFIEFKQAKAARDWPGINALMDDVLKRLAAGVFKRNYAPSLRKYLTERWWKTPIESRARASPQFPSDVAADDVTTRNANNFREVIAEMTQKSAQRSAEQ